MDHPNLALIISLLTAYLVTVLMTPLLKRFAKRFNITDAPSPRKVHETNIPLLGGVALFFGFAMSQCIVLNFNPTVRSIRLGALLIVCIGAFDDIWGMRPWHKLLGQFIVAGVSFYYGIRIDFITNPFGHDIIHLGHYSFPLTMIWFLAVMNALNLIDGLDGLAAGVAGISSIFLVLAAVIMGQTQILILLLAMVGICAGFLHYNFAPAQIFMGDSGSLLLGYLLASVSIIGVLKSPVALSLCIPILVLGVPFLDTSFAIIRRVLTRKAIFQADNAHIHHRLVAIGLSQKQTTLFLYLCGTAFGAVALFLLV